MEIYLYVYAFGYLVWMLALTKELTFTDMAASAIVAIVWPIHMPAMLFKKLFK